MRDRLLIFYAFLIVTIITGVTLFAASGSVYLLKGDESGEQFVELADLYILNSLSEDSISGGNTFDAQHEQELSQGTIIYDDNFVDESAALKKVQSPAQSKSLLSELKKKDLHWYSREHTIVKGDSIWKLAKQYETDYTLIIAHNSLSDPDQIIPGRKLTILTKQGIDYKIQNGDTLSEIALTYGISQKSIRETNQIGEHIHAGARIFLPGAKEIEKPTSNEKGLVSAMKTVAPPDTQTSETANARESANDTETDSIETAAATADTDNGKSEKTESKPRNKMFNWPAKGRISSGFGMRVSPVYGEEMFHNGIDICVNEGTEVKAAASGKVIFAGWKDGYGNMVVIRHRNNYLTVYAHLLEAKVTADQRVSANQVIAISGNTGLTTGAHLHFEIRKYDTPLNPLRML